MRLKNGTEVRGGIVSLDATKTVVQTAYGTMTIPQGEIVEIRYGQVPTGKVDSVGSSIAYLVQRKDSSTAFLYALLISGGGHFYAGETETGGYLLVGHLGGWVLAVVGSGSGNGTLTIIWAVGALGTWIYGMADAPAAVNRYNQRLEEKSGLRSGAGIPSLLRIAVRW